MTVRTTWLSLAAASLFGCTSSEEPPQPNTATISEGTPATRAEWQIDAAAEAAARAIEAERLREVVAEIADDRYAGRAPGTAGDQLTRTYIATELERIGFARGGVNGGWEQPFELVGITTMAPRSWPFRKGDQTIELEWSKDYIGASGVQSERAEISETELVFVGYGIQAPEYQWDDYKGVDVSGKILVMLNNDPDWDPQLFAGGERLYYGRWTYKYESAARRGAAGALIIHTTPSAGYPWQVVQSSWGGEQFELPAGDELRIQLAGWVTEDAARRLIGPTELDALVEQARRRDFTPVPLGIRASIELRNTLTRTETANVIGVLRGSDPDVADEFVVYTAHHDHLGVGEPNAAGDPNDGIYNGARDNASGVAMLLGLGAAYANLPEPPRRSIMLLFVAAEEQGLLGSEYFAKHPTVPPGKIAANINFDSGNIWGPTGDITFIGLGKSTLDSVARRVAAHQGRTLKGDQFPDEGSYYRSDQFNFAKIGVPAFYFDPGTEYVGRPEGWGVERENNYDEHDYHQPSDEITPEWSFDGMAQDAQFGFFAGLVVANSDGLPTWNPGNEFEAARRAALDAVQ
jgi:Zn-dependent M28 family amino/carboxypeptidase